MKKIIISFLVALLFIQNAMADCKIKNQPSEELKAYIKDFETMMKNISSYSAPKKERSIYDFWVGLYNEAFQFENFTTKFDFFTDFIKTQELPKEVIRDYNKLKNEDNYLRETTKYVSNNNLSQVKVKNICAGISWRCDFKDWDELWYVLRKVGKNHEVIKTVFMKIASGDEDFSKQIKNYILIRNNFFNDMATHYSNISNIECSKEKWRFWDRISQKTNEIFQNEKSAKEWAKKWKEAREMISKIKALPREEQEAIERDLLNKELSKQWISWDAQKNILEALEKYNKNGGFSADNNPISNTFKSAIQSFKNAYQGLKEEVSADFIENYRKKSANQPLPVQETAIAKWNTKESKSVKSRIEQLYFENKNYSAVSEYNEDNLRTKLIDSHTSISNSIKKLIKTCKMAVKICNQQDAWNGDCWDCNW